MYSDSHFDSTGVSEITKDYYINQDYFQNTENIEDVNNFLTQVPNLIELPNINTQNRASPYKLTDSSYTTPTHSKYGKYKPMEWTLERILELLHTSNDGRFVLADSKANDGFLSDDGQNTLTKLLINFLFQDNSNSSTIIW